MWRSSGALASRRLMWRRPAPPPGRAARDAARTAGEDAGAPAGVPVEYAPQVRFRTWGLPFVGIATGLLAWQIAVWLNPATLVPGPLAVARGIGELAVSGLLVK